jgi:site-specific recombinase XerD
VRVLKGKGGVDRVAALDYRCIDQVRYWIAVRERLPGVNGRQRLFCSISNGTKRRPGRPMHPSYVRRLLPRLAETAVIEKRVHPHGLRHTYSNELLDRGVPLQHISQTLGHTHVSTTDTYLRKLNPTDTVAAIRAAGLTVTRP